MRFTIGNDPDYTVLKRELGYLTRTVEKMMIDVSKIKAAADRANAGIESVLAVLMALTGQVKDLSKQLADAIAANDPVAQKAVQDQLNTLAVGLDVESDRIAAATAAPAV